MKISENSNVYMEITNPVHGGEGWELGEVLWSPATSNWKIMTEIKPGDIIIHSMSSGKPHQLVGMSRVKRSVYIMPHEPLKPGKWAGYEKYYRIELQEYSNFEKRMPLKDFFDKYKKEILKLGEQNSFYALSKDRTSVVGTAQKYMAKVPNKVQELLKDWFDQNNIGVLDNIAVSNDDDTKTDSVDLPKVPGRTRTTTERIIRDTALIRELKKDYDNICQICGQRIKVPNGKFYSEGHHLKKLGGIHQGPDNRENVMILCPFHHAEFDYGSIAVNPKTKIIEHIDVNNEYFGKAMAYQRDDLGEEYLKYHYQKIYNKE